MFSEDDKDLTIPASEVNIAPLLSRRNKEPQKARPSWALSAVCGRHGHVSSTHLALDPGSETH